MNILFAAFHPVDPYIVQHVARALEIKGHKVLFIIHEKENIIQEIVKTFGYHYYTITNQSEFYANKLYFTIKYLRNAGKIIRNFKPNIIFSPTSPFVGLLANLFRVPLICWADTETALINLRTSAAFCSAILTPDCFFKKVNNKKHIPFAGYKELAYLHPNHFLSGTKFMQANVMKDGKSILMRFSALKAMHDRGLKSAADNQKSILLHYIQQLEEYARVFISISEKDLGKEFSKYKLDIHPTEYHNFLANCSLYIGEGTTTASEAGVLGVPWIALRPDPLGYLEDQEKKYELGFRTVDLKYAFETAIKWLNHDGLKDEWAKKREKLLADKIDVSAFFVWFIENYPDSHKIMKNNPDYQNQFRNQ